MQGEVRMNIDFYKTKPELRPITNHKGTHYLVQTEERTVMNDAIFRTVMNTEQNKIAEIFDIVFAEEVMIPSVEHVIIQIIGINYFPSLVQATKISLIENREYWQNYLSSVTDLVMKDFENPKNAKIANKFLKSYLKKILELYASPRYVSVGNSQYATQTHHIMEEATREEDRSRFGKLFEANKLFAIQGIENCFKDVTTNNEDKIGIIRWYVGSSKLLAKKEFKVSFARVLNADSEGSHKAVAYRIAEEYYEELKEVYEGHPELDFLINGITEYQNVADFARAAGYEIEEIFPEKSPIAEGQDEKAAGVRGFRDISPDKKHALDVLNSLNELQHLVGGSDTLIINFKKKDDEKKADVFGKYIGIAFVRNCEWWILTDCLKPENAIYLWRGASYKEGITYFRHSKAYARSHAQVFRKNHKEGVRSYDRYVKLLQDNGLMLRKPPG